MNLGYIKLYRKVTSSFVWTNSDMFKLWILCLMKASHEDRKFLFNGQEVRLTSGQFVTGAHAIAKEYNEGVPSDKAIAWRTLWRWLKKFENEELLTIQSNARYSVITIINWSDYQSSDKPVTSDGQSNDKPVTTNKNDKNDKNDKNNNPRNTRKSRAYADDDPNKKLAILLLKLIRKNQNIKEPDLDKWANTIRLTIESDKRTGKEVQDMIVWATSHEFWSSVILSPTSLRKHFDTMTAQKDKRKQQTIATEDLPETGEEW
ncbi:hypothetical protein [Enterococcus mundtii]|uniref:hypothetical protein n=1 Tax=Enterococcus mundtii TaxID=53346 RepID=UPI00032E1A6E|nr:hypothetical protein [Enterococcus mundtii]EOH58841.1 hypothetical protein UAC_02980 [Enterococcus mundtii ATCC 882]EOU13656.1 hypothetical protein I587_02210 [Enterococcus mundtii ATCC 882]PJK26537.1 hypothetical protein CV769_04175 [Enterococcus mundtii]